MADQLDAQPFPSTFVPVCAIGASAGGVAALQTLFRLLPDDLGLAYVVVMHLAPDHPSAMDEILRAVTRMPVLQVSDGPTLRPDQVYVIAPDRELVIDGDDVRSRPFTDPRGRRAPIDMFFRSIAAGRGDGIAVVLTGAGSDGAVGVRAVKEAGGVIMVQEPAEAGFPSMPQNAIATGVADVVAPLARLAERIAEAARSKEAVRSLDEDGDANQVRRLIAFLRTRTGHDFSGYKRATVLRRIGRRMQVCQINSLPDYARHLREAPEEARALFADLLISVTMFFRDPDTFAALTHQVIRPLLEGRAADEDGTGIRAWVVGCATGEEAYSLAILLLEEAERQSVHLPIQIFATDLDEGALATAREGRYPRSIEADVSAERLRRFFIDEGSHYRISGQVRDLVLFATHSVVREPPFMRLDLVTCRNVLIYLERALQHHVCGIFHYGLKPDGYVFLGTAETIDASQRQFAVVDRDARIYRALPAGPQFLPTLISASPISGGRRALIESRPAASRFDAGDVTGASHAVALEASAPPSALVDAEHGVLHLSQTAGQRFVQLSAGPLSSRLPSIVRPELRLDLKLALDRVFETGQPTLTRLIDVAIEGEMRRTSLHIAPVPTSESSASRAIVFFLDNGPVRAGLDEEPAPPFDELQHLHSELKVAQESELAGRLRHDSVVQELRASNEELQSLNEEYRSTAEELETSKEELQSINEELQTVNAELKSKLAVISGAHNDLRNLTDSSEIGTLFLDLGLRIRMFTPPVADLINLTQADIGRPITDLTHKLDYEAFDRDLQTAMRERQPAEKEVRTRDGGWFLLRIRPYRTLDGAIEGAVITFDDVTARKSAELGLRRSEEWFRSLVVASNNTFYRMSADWGLMYRLDSDTLAGTPEPIADWRDKYILAADRTEVEAAISKAIRAKAPFELEHRVLLADDTVGWVLSRAVPLIGPKGEITEWSGVAADVTERRRAVEALRESEEQHRRLFENMDQGYLICDVIFDDDGRAVDIHYVQSNAAAARMMGVDPTGKRLSEVSPKYDAYWYEIWGRVATTGRSERLLRYATPERRWYDFHAFKLDPGDPAARRVAVLFYDATEAKQAEERQGFLLQLSDAIRPLQTPEAILDVATDRLRAQIAASRTAYYEIENGDYVILTDSTDAVPSIVGRYPLAMFGSALRNKHLSGQSPIVVNDVGALHDVAERESFEAIQVGAYIGVTLSKQGQFGAGLTVHSVRPRVWTAHEVILVGQTAERIGAAVERSRAEAALRHSEERFRQFGEASADVLWIVDATTGQLEYLSPSFERIWGVPREAVMSDLSLWGEILHPEDRARALTALPRVLAGEAVAQEYRILRRDGSVRYITDVGFPIVDDAGRVVRVGGIAQDLTERRQAEAAVQDSERRQRALIDGVPQLVWRAIDGGKWTWASPQWTAFTGQAEADSHGEGWLDPVHPDDRDRLQAIWAGAIERGEFHADYRIRNAAEGRYCWFQARATPVRGERGEIIEWLGTSTDVDALRQLQDRQQVLVAELQHRTRNLMGVVSATAEATLRSSADLDEFAQKFRDRVDALSRVQGLLSRLNVGERVTFDGLIGSELNALGFGDKPDKVSLDGPRGVALRSSTVQTFALAMHELATNALKYGALRQPTGRLSVSWRLEPAGPDGKPWLHLDWRESGVTMPPSGSAPQGSGQGRLLIERALPYQLGARTTYVMGPDGVRCSIAVPVSSRTAAEEIEDEGPPAL